MPKDAKSRAPRGGKFSQIIGSAVSDVSKCRSLTLLTRPARLTCLNCRFGVSEGLSASEECRRSVGGVSIDTSVGRVEGVRVSIDTSVQVSGQGSNLRAPDDAPEA